MKVVGAVAERIEDVARHDHRRREGDEARVRQLLAANRGEFVEGGRADHGEVWSVAAQRRAQRGLLGGAGQENDGVEHRRARIFPLRKDANAPAQAVTSSRLADVPLVALVVAFGAGDAASAALAP